MGHSSIKSAANSRPSWLLRAAFGALRYAYPGALVSLCGAPLHAFAHGDPPTPLSLLARDGEAAALVLLDSAMARRTALSSFEYVCPARWGEEVSTPTVALDAQCTLVVGREALMVVEGERVERHPHALAQQAFADLLTLDGRLLGLLVDGAGTWLYEITRDDVALFFHDEVSWQSAHADARGVLLSRLADGRVEQLRVASDGKRGTVLGAALSQHASHVLSRSAGERDYVVTLMGPKAELAVIEAGGYRRLLGPASAILGPVMVAEQTLVALDGQLQVLDGELATPVSDASNLTCLYGGVLPYACTREAILSVTVAGLGQPLFSLTQLAPPELQNLMDPETRAACELQWEHARFDLQSIGIEPKGMLSPMHTHPTAPASAKTNGCSVACSPGAGLSLLCLWLSSALLLGFRRATRPW